MLISGLKTDALFRVLVIKLLNFLQEDWIELQVRKYARTVLFNNGLVKLHHPKAEYLAD